MIIVPETPLERAQAKRERIERELKKCPDFQLYLIAKSRKDLARMERLLMQIPMFRIWRTLANSIELWRTLANSAERAGPRFRHPDVSAA
jgi:hypothetical protein